MAQPSGQSVADLAELEGRATSLVASCAQLEVEKERVDQGMENLFTPSNLILAGLSLTLDTCSPRYICARITKRYHEERFIMSYSWRYPDHQLQREEVIDVAWAVISLANLDTGSFPE
jgi:hypothetical protein